MKNYDEIMMKHGATEKIMQSKTAKILVNALAEEEGFVDACLIKAVENLKNDVEETRKIAENSDAMVRKAQVLVQNETDNLKNTMHNADYIITHGEKLTVKDPVSVESLNIYRSVMMITCQIAKEATGSETVSEAVILSAIDAAKEGMVKFITAQDIEPEPVEWQ